MPAQADINFERELWGAAVNMRGTVAPADYKHYVLPLLFLRYLSLRYEQRHQQLETALKEPGSEYYTGDPEVDAETLAYAGLKERRDRLSHQLEAAGFDLAKLATRYGW